MGVCVLWIMIVLYLVGVADHYFVGNKKGPISVQIYTWMRRNTIIRQFGIIDYPLKWMKEETKSGIMSWKLQKNAKVIFVYWIIW